MGEWLGEYFGEIKKIWNGLNSRAQIVIGISVVSVLIGLLILVMAGRTSDYQILFSQLDSRDANEIVENLEDRGIPYRLSEGGTTIKVPADQLHKTRLQMAGEGLPHQGVVGFEIFDESQFGTTDFDRQVNYYRALGGELSRSIQTMESIEFARVQVSAPEESLFIEEQEPAKASVLLELRPGVSLGHDQVEAITNLVASGVSGLEPDKVTVVDSRGTLLTADSGEDSGRIDYSSNLDYQRQFERGLQNDLERLLSRVLGPGNFSVQVRANLNFDQSESEAKTYTPVVDDSGILRSEEERIERYEGSDSEEAGVPGATSNLPQYQTGEEGESHYSYRSSDRVTNYEINERIERHVYAPGKVEQLSVSVLVDNQLGLEQIDSIEDSVRAAIGFNPERNDTVTVSQIAFDDSLEQEIARMRSAAEAEEARRMYLYAALIIFILLVVFIAAMVLRPRKKPEPGEQLDVTLEEEMREADEAEEEIAAAELTEEQKRRKQMKKQLESLVYENPEGVADILKSWLTQD